MASYMTQRRPLATRHIQGPSNQSPSVGKQVRIVSGSKRALSSDQPDMPTAPSLKRARATIPLSMNPPPPRDLQKERKQAERDQKAAEFRQKYTRAFPTWTFYIDSENVSQNMQQNLKSKIHQLRGKVDVFFSASITHLITDISVANADKENSLTKTISSKQILKSPIKIPNRGGDGLAASSLVNKAMEYGMKIWSTAKLESVLSRCLDAKPAKPGLSSRTMASNHLSLSALLQTERMLGSTERDPTQKRHDYRYFSKSSCFVLVEDISQELAPIAIHEYPICKDKDKSAKKPWPVLHCHPHSRNPFIPFDEREKKRWERVKQQQAGKAEDLLRNKKEMEIIKRKAEARSHIKAQGDLRRSASLNNMNRRLSLPERIHNDGRHFEFENNDYDDYDSANASGYVSGAYIAASGNSVGITSTTGTTSTSGNHRTIQLPTAIVERLKQHVTTSLKFTNKDKTEDAERSADTGIMGPPPMLPSKQVLLRRSKSTNTLKLPKREETSKPGYCESCRAKFSDFSTHTYSRKHRKFATNPANFEVLDLVLDRLRRKTRSEVEDLEAQRRSHMISRCKRTGHYHRGHDSSSVCRSSP